MNFTVIVKRFEGKWYASVANDGAALNYPVVKSSAGEALNDALATCIQLIVSSDPVEVTIKICPLPLPPESTLIPAEPPVTQDMLDEAARIPGGA